MAVVEISSGVCGFTTRIEGSADASLQVALEITSECSRIQDLAQHLTQVSAMEELFQPITETQTYRAAAKCGLHTACPVPSAILKAIEVASGMALPADVHMTIHTN
ncbi:MAG: hypothetical protein U9R48_09880 [Chloroflexota bacterium]|nr:hypothetical protein [Chloroflexota bacterium]